MPSYLEPSQMLLKGCWLPDDQGGNSCSSAKCKFQAVRSPPYYFCCCNTDLCNHSIPPPIKGEWKILIQLLYITSKAQQMQRKLLFQGTRDSVIVSALVFGLNKSRAFSWKTQYLFPLPCLSQDRDVNSFGIQTINITGKELKCDKIWNITSRNGARVPAIVSLHPGVKLSQSG